jgi:signal peptidase
MNDKKPYTVISIIQKIFYAVLVAAILAMIGLFVASLIQIPGHIEIKIVKSGSMEPAIKTGSIVFIKPESAYVVGDVITFGEDSKTAIPTTHRIIAIRQSAGATYYTTKGDANNAPEQNETEKNNVIGKVMFTLPYAGYILNFAKQPIGFSLLIGLPAGIIAVNEIIAIWAETKKMFGKKKRGIEFTASSEADGYNQKEQSGQTSAYRDLEIRRQRLLGMSDIRNRDKRKFD